MKIKGEHKHNHMQQTYSYKWICMGKDLILCPFYRSGYWLPWNLKSYLWVSVNKRITLRGPMTCQQWLLTPSEWSALLLGLRSIDKEPSIPSGLLLWLATVLRSCFLLLSKTVSARDKNRFWCYADAICGVLENVRKSDWCTVLCRTNLDLFCIFTLCQLCIGYFIWKYSTKVWGESQSHKSEEGPVILVIYFEQSTRSIVVVNKYYENAFEQTMYLQNTVKCLFNPLNVDLVSYAIKATQ